MRKRTIQSWIAATVFIVSQSASAAVLDLFQIRGMRVDPAFLYNEYPWLEQYNAHQVAQDIVEKTSRAGVNTLFVQAYNPTYGAFYETNLPGTYVEETLGRADFLNLLTAEAQRARMKVVAVLPLNNFRHLWELNPSWRSKKQNGLDYQPPTHLSYQTEMYLLSAFHPDFRNWSIQFIRDFLQRHPTIDAVEFDYPVVDKFWSGEPDFNQAAIDVFRSIYPTAEFNSYEWLYTRSLGLTELVNLLSVEISNTNKPVMTHQTWPAQEDGRLFAAKVVSLSSGYNMHALRDKPYTDEPYDVDYFSVDFSWHKWKVTFGNEVFKPDWITTAFNTAQKEIKGQTAWIGSIDISTYQGPFGVININRQEFIESVRALTYSRRGVDIYGFHIVNRNNWWEDLRRAWSLAKPKPILPSNR